MPNLYPLPTNQRFVFFFNSVAATLWFCCLGRFLILLPLVGRKFLPGGIADFFHIVSLTPLFGFLLLKSILYTNVKLSDLWALFNGLKMAWICYGVIFPHPKIAKHTSYSLLILAWCIQYVIHYSYHAFRIKTRSSPWFLFWLQYHNFYITYPVGLVAEMILIFLSLMFVEDDLIYEYVLKFALLSYIPVAYFAWNNLRKRRNLKYTEVLSKRNRSKLQASNTESSANTSGVSNETQETELRELS